MSVQQFNFPTKIRFGEGAIKELGPALVAQGLKRPLLVTDRSLAKLDVIKNAEHLLKESGLKSATFSDFEGNPIETHVLSGVKAYKDHNADSIVMMGGGAALDVGKAIALMAHHPGSLFDYEDDKPDGLPVDQHIPFVIAVPTTAGTGSEVGRSSVISINDTKAKKIIFSPRLLPPIVIADPELTYGLPPSITMATGLDAFTHCLEAFLAKGWHPMCEGIALEGIRIVAKYLPTAIKEPKNTEARRHMLLASIMGATAFQKGLGVNHSCAHALSTVYDFHHGLANGLMLDACIAYNLNAVPEKALPLSFAVGILGVDAKSAPAAFLEWLSAFATTCGLPKGLGKQRVKANDALLDVAFADVCHGSNPRPVSREDFRKLFETAM